MPKPSRNLFVVLSPLQIICAQEARERFCRGDDNYLVVVNRTGTDSADTSHKMREMDAGWARIIHVRETPRRGPARVPIRLWNTFKIALAYRSAGGKVFLGDPMIDWFGMLGKIFGGEVVWLDDGAASVNVLHRFRNTDALTTPNPTTPRYFTIFADDATISASNGAIMRNDLSYLRSLGVPDQPTEPRTALFIGQWLSENGGVDQDAEVAALRHAVSLLDGWTVTYVPHRHETEAKLARFADFVDIVRFDEALERKLLKSPTKPEMILGWYSSALFTLKRLYPEIIYHAVHAPLGAASAKQRDAILQVYDALEDMGVTRLGPDQRLR